jgi:uncharacterized damage-inducible protein DinB
MVHAMSAEWGWLDRCGGPQRGGPLKADDFPTVESIASTWTRVEEYVRGFLSTLRDEDLRRPVEFTLGAAPKQSMPLGELMHHAAVHAVHHRGQIALLLRALGHAPGNVDILFYYGERPTAAQAG